MSKTHAILLAGSALSSLAAAIAFADAPADADQAAQADEIFNFTAGVHLIGDARQPRGLMRHELSLVNDPSEALSNSFDADDRWAPVVQLFLRDNGSGAVFFSCSGTLINPRTVLTAAHCVNFVSSEAFGRNPRSAPFSILAGVGPDTRTAFFRTVFDGFS